MTMRLSAAVLLGLGLVLGQACTPREGGDRTAGDRAGEDAALEGSGDTTASLGGGGEAGTMGLQPRVTELAASGMKEVEVGSIATKRGASEKVQKFGDRLVTDHRKANNELRELVARKGLTLPQQLPEDMGESVQELAELQGAEFDQRFAEEMVADHEKTIANLQEITRDESADPDLQGWAQKALPTVQEHLRIARSLQDAGGNR